MNKTLFTMHDIKYIISVDDCYCAPKREDVESSLYVEMQSSMEAFREKLNSIGRASIIDEYDELTNMGISSDSLIKDLINSLTNDEVADLYSIIDETPYHSERDCILEFLSDLKKQGCIEKYYTCGTTSDAIALDFNKEDMTGGNILWLLDRNFERVGESPDAGIQLAHSIVRRETGPINYIYILSAVGKDSASEDDIELEFDEVLSSLCPIEITSFIYYINKQRIIESNERKIERSLAQGFKRKVCYELFQIYRECLKTSVDKSTETICRIKQKTLNYLFYQKAAKDGESRSDLLMRLVQIFQTDEYNCALASKHESIAERLFNFEVLCTGVKDGIGDINELTPDLTRLREIELYNKHINAQHFEISTGDIFRIEDKHYLLVSQSCDTYLRPDGNRKLDFACLLQIIDQTESIDYKRKLSCFLDFKKPLVAYQSQRVLPFDILDLCVINRNGQACITVESLLGEKEYDMKYYSENYTSRYKTVIAHIKKVYEFRSILERYLDKDANITSEHAKVAFQYLLDEDSIVKKYTIHNNMLYYPVQRICRLDELTTVDIVKDYSSTLSRIGQPFDFST